jgi:hypothetical protein
MVSIASHPQAHLRFKERIWAIVYRILAAGQSSQLRQADPSSTPDNAESIVIAFA